MFPISQILVLSQTEFVRHQVDNVLSGQWSRFWRRREAD